MRASLTHRDLFNQCPAGCARLTIAVINLEVILKITPAINPINAGTLALNALAQHIPNRPQQALRIFDS